LGVRGHVQAQGQNDEEQAEEDVVIWHSRKSSCLTERLFHQELSDECGSQMPPNEIGRANRRRVCSFGIWSDSALLASAGVIVAAVLSVTLALCKNAYEQITFDCIHSLGRQHRVFDSLLVQRTDQNPSSGKQIDTGLALHQLELLVAHLEAKKDTKAIELLTDYQHALDGQQASAAIATNIRLILQKLREGRTQEVIEWQESRLASDAVTLYASYNQIRLRPATSKPSVAWVRPGLFTKYPVRTRLLFQKEGLAKASSYWMRSLDITMSANRAHALDGGIPSLLHSAHRRRASERGR